VSIVNKIAKDFRASTNFSINNEEKLFTELANAITNNSNSVFVGVTHGATRANVSFNLTTDKPARCEIADLLIITKSRKFPFLRATFWQAKKQKKSKWVSLGTADKHIDFTGQFDQWDLLSRRPSITGIAPFNPPNDLLSCFQDASIGSFGVFYERDSVIELVHSVAAFVACGNPSAKHPALVVNANLERYFCPWCGVAVVSGLESFIHALINHHVGARLLPSEESHKWLASYAAKKVASYGKDLPKNFFLEFEEPSEPVGDYRDGISVLLIDTGDLA